MHHLARTWSWSIVLFALLASATPADGQTEGEYLYNVTMLRAAPGHFTELIQALREAEAIHREAGDRVPFRVRHSQGDQWDFMLIRPMGSLGAYAEASRMARREAAWNSPAGTALSERLEAFTAYEEEWFARSVPVEELGRRFEGSGLFHIEMFAGLPGKRGELLEQRRMENRYYRHLGRQENVLFVREAGPNWDAMTIGFYPSLQDYAAAGVRYSEEQQNDAALAAGFDGVSDISPYLRSLLSYHHDTLAVPVN
ncbi:MAG: hypothetical protein OEO23_00185 [Gemmatimonadota bacterium]|nr:hypothetical protein [Gemmatimonadota bacterium]